HSLALAVVAGYIDLNPVRAQLVHDPLEYRWNGYAEAMAGNASQRDALESVLPPEYRCLESYRMLIHQAGREQFGPDGRPTRPGFKPETIARVWTEGGRISAAELIRCRVRYMVEGVVIGSREFVEDVFRGIRSYYNPRRRTGARRLRGLDPPVFSLKRFRLNPVTAPEPAGGSPGHLPGALCRATLPQEFEHVPFVGLIPRRLHRGHGTDVQPVDVGRALQFGDELRIPRDGRAG